MEKHNQAPDENSGKKKQEAPPSSGLRYENLVASLFFGKGEDKAARIAVDATTTARKR
jgi:hypothetical protein